MARIKIELSDKEIESIEAMAGYGMSVEKIAHVLRMSKVTLERRMRDTPPERGAKDAMSRGRAKAEAEVTQTAYKMATSGNKTDMTKFWLNCRAGWRATTVIENTGKDGAPLPPVAQVIIELPAKDVPQD